MKAYLPGMGNTPIAATPRPSYLLQSLMMGSILHLVTPHRQAKQRPVRACHSDPHSCCDGSLLVDYYLTDDDDDGSHVDDFNRDDKGVHHNKEDNPFPQSHTQYTQSQNSLWTANGTDIPSSNWLRDEKRVNLTRWPRPTHGHHYPSRPSVIPSSNGLKGLDGFYLTTVSKIPPGWSTETFKRKNNQLVWRKQQITGEKGYSWMPSTNWYLQDVHILFMNLISEIHGQSLFVFEFIISHSNNDTYFC